MVVTFPLWAITAAFAPGLTSRRYSDKPEREILVTFSVSVSARITAAVPNA